MVRMSDIFKKAMMNKAKVAREESQEQLPDSLPQQIKQVKFPQSPAMPKEESKGKRKAKQESKPGVSISRSVKVRFDRFSDEEIVSLYDETIILIKDTYERIKDGEDISEEDKNIAVYVEKFINQQSLGGDEVLSLLHSAPGENRLYSQIINVGVISIEIGLGLKYDKAKLIELGTAAFSHKIGMIKFYDSSTKLFRSDKVKFREIEQYTELTPNIIEKFRDKSGKFITVVYQDLERRRKTDYLQGLKEELIFEYAKIIGLADLYEALVRPHSQRGWMQPYEVLNLILHIKSSFGSKVVKSFIERISCPFPLGSYVHLSSGENAKVIGRNLGYPMRPIVEVIPDAEGKGSESGRIIDLKEYSTTHIQGYLKS